MAPSVTEPSANTHLKRGQVPVDDGLHAQEAEIQERAAIRIQRVWREKTRGEVLNPDSRWLDVSLHARLRVGRDDADAGKNDPPSRWKRATFLASRLRDGNRPFQHPGVSGEEGAIRKELETQHWLELIDGKHRYGSNLKHYHRRWQAEDTLENFFRWLDHGGGKDLSLPECSREQLEKERIIYLSPEQRLNYLVKIDAEGKLRWGRTGQLVDTTGGHWRDAGRGQGIVQEEHPGRTDLRPRTSFGSSGSLPSISVALGEPSGSPEAATHLASDTKSGNWRRKVVKNNLTLKGVMDKLSKKSVKRSTWIYVSDKNFNIFIGIKDTGTFQHSSFLGGGLVSSAGLISVKQGVIHTLSPLSGHYRTSIDNFHQFCDALNERGVDMHKVRYGKAEAAFWGVKHLNKAKKKEASVTQTGKDIAKKAADKTASVFNPNEDDGLRKWKREVIFGKGGPI